jgi:hypothetical protein
VVFHIFVRFTPRYLIFLEAIVNGIVFIHSFSVCLLLVYTAFLNANTHTHTQKRRKISVEWN